MTGKIDAILALRSGDHVAVGRERVRMLEAIEEQGSISAAAKALGFSYKYAWDAIAAINNLTPRPVIETQSGGRKGGGARLTDDGRHFIAAFRRLEEKLDRIAQALVENNRDDHPDLLFWSVAMKTSARNAFHCQVEDIILGDVNAKVRLGIIDGVSITAVITRESAQTMRLSVGSAVVALVKASLVMLATGVDGTIFSTHNRIMGTIARRIDGAVNSEIVLDIGQGKKLTAIITRESADSLELAEDSEAMAFFEDSHVILASI